MITRDMIPRSNKQKITTTPVKITTTPGEPPRKGYIYTVDPITGKTNWRLLIVITFIGSLPIWVGIGMLLYYGLGGQ